ncbi:MAG TPA: Phenylacetic acid catabolic protein [Roseiflexaceae bacterium]|nr:Phenylacetic acid catabolic protein [Roseiflexaceae bacterium]
MSEIEQTLDVEGIGLPQGTKQEFAIEDDAALAALVNLIAVLADNEYFYGLRISDWSMGAPMLEAGVACAAIAQEKLGHSRALYPLLEELPWPNPPTPMQREIDRQRRYSVRFLDQPFPTWSHVVATIALLGPALNTLFGGLTNSKYAALAIRMRRILDEEKLTTWYAESLVRDLVAAPEGRAMLQARVDELWPEIMCWFGPQGEPGVECLVREGLLSIANEDMRQSYLGKVMPLLEEVGIRVSARRDDATNTWDYGELPWSQWNNLQRRLS